MTPPTHQGGQLDQVDSEIKTFRSGSSQVPQGLSITPLPTQVDQVDSKIKDMG